MLENQPNKNKLAHKWHHNDVAEGDYTSKDTNSHECKQIDYHFNSKLLRTEILINIYFIMNLIFNTWQSNGIYRCKETKSISKIKYEIYMVTLIW